MIRFSRAGPVLVFLGMTLSAVAPVRADQPLRYDYGFCMGIAGNPRVEAISPVFHRLAGGAPEGGRSWVNTVNDRYHTGVRESGCSYFPTAAEAEAKRRELIDTITRNMGPAGVALIDWQPRAAPASPPKPAPTAVSAPPVPHPAAVPSPPKPKPHAASAASKGQFVVCNGIDLIAAKFYFNPPVEVTSGDAGAWSASYAQYLHTKYRYDRNIACTKFATLAEAQSYHQETSDQRKGAHDLNGNPAPEIMTDWKYP